MNDTMSIILFWDRDESAIRVAEEILLELLDGSFRKLFSMLQSNSKDEGALRLKVRGHNGKEYYTA